MSVDLLEARAQPRSDQRQGGDLPKRWRVVPSGKRRIVRDEEDPRVAHQLDHLERPLLQGRHREREVEIAALDRVQEDWVRGRLFELNLDAWPLGSEPTEESGEDLCPGALE